MYEFWVQWIRPVAAAVALSPMPMVALLLGGLWLRKRGTIWLGNAATVVAIAAIWLGGCACFGETLERLLLKVPAPLSDIRIQALRREYLAHGDAGIIVIGSGIFQNSLEYRESRLSAASLERLRYGIWLSRRTGIPLGFSGGVGWAGEPGDSEAGTAQRIATHEFGYPLKWVEDKSRDTLENATKSVPMMRSDGTKHILLVTSGVQMQRALGDFDRANAMPKLLIEAAPMNLAAFSDQKLYGWLPSADGYATVTTVLREWLGQKLGA